MVVPELVLAQDLVQMLKFIPRLEMHVVAFGHLLELVHHLLVSEVWVFLRDLRNLHSFQHLRRELILILARLDGGVFWLC